MSSFRDPQQSSQSTFATGSNLTYSVIVIAKVVRASTEARAGWVPDFTNRDSIEPPRCKRCDSVMGMMVSDFGKVKLEKGREGKRSANGGFGAVHWEGIQTPAQAGNTAERRAPEAIDPLNARHGSETSMRRIQRYASMV